MLLLLPGVAAGALEIQLPSRVAYVYSMRQPPGVVGKQAYNTYLRHMMVDGKPITVQVQAEGLAAAVWLQMCASHPGGCHVCRMCSMPGPRVPELPSDTYL